MTDSVNGPGPGQIPQAGTLRSDNATPAAVPAAFAVDAPSSASLAPANDATGQSGAPGDSEVSGQAMGAPSTPDVRPETGESAASVPLSAAISSNSGIPGAAVPGSPVDSVKSTVMNMESIGKVAMRGYMLQAKATAVLSAVSRGKMPHNLTHCENSFDLLSEDELKMEPEMIESLVRGPAPLPPPQTESLIQEPLAEVLRQRLLVEDVHSITILAGVDSVLGETLRCLLGPLLKPGHLLVSYYRYQALLEPVSPQEILEGGIAMDRWSGLIDTWPDLGGVSNVTLIWCIRSKDLYQHQLNCDCIIPLLAALRRVSKKKVRVFRFDLHKSVFQQKLAANVETGAHLSPTSMVARLNEEARGFDEAQAKGYVKMVTLKIKPMTGPGRTSNVGFGLDPFDVVEKAVVKLDVLHLVSSSPSMVALALLAPGFFTDTDTMVVPYAEVKLAMLKTLQVLGPGFTACVAGHLLGRFAYERATARALVHTVLRAFSITKPVRRAIEAVIGNEVEGLFVPQQPASSGAGGEGAAAEFAVAGSSAEARAASEVREE